MTSKRTKKQHNKKTKDNLWSLFDDNIDNKEELMCLYTNAEVGERDSCDICNSLLAYDDDRFKTCTNDKCGIIYKDRLDNSAEWRYYGADDNKKSDPTRCGMPINPLLKESSYGCKVIVSGSATYEMRKIRRYTEWQSMPYKEKSQYDEFVKINLLAGLAGIPKILIDEAHHCHKKISEMKTFRGCNRDGIIAASIYMACRMHDYPRTAKEIASIFKLDNTAATKGCKNASQIVNHLEKDMPNDDKTRFNQTTPADFIERYASKLGINKELTTVCMFVANKISRGNMIPENTPHSVAAGIIYFVAQVCKLNINKKNLNSVSEISEVTINKCYKKCMIIHQKNQLVPSCILKKYAEN
tara:strand:- start:850 stop:1917 length:1068 start_codon:yes stop_codon:yes gene_type:complete